MRGRHFAQDEGASEGLREARAARVCVTRVETCGQQQYAPEGRPWGACIASIQLRGVHPVSPLCGGTGSAVCAGGTGGVFHATTTDCG
jgi:hypothetical protein